VLRDLAKLQAVDLVVERAGAPKELADRLRRSLAEPEWGALHGRRQLEELVRRLQVAELRAAGGSGAAADLIERRHLTPGYDVEADVAYGDVIERILA
jgi:hypothetical protein